MLLVPYVAISSFLGLTGWFLLWAPVFGLVFFVQVWITSTVADALFVLGSVATGVAGYRKGRESAWAGVVVAALGSWATYALSWFVVGVASGDTIGLGQSVAFVATVGVGGLTFATAAPVVLARRHAHAQERAALAARQRAQDA